MNPVLRRYAGYNVPRYTSYPTAADFSADVGAKDHETWLAGLGADQAVSVDHETWLAGLGADQAVSVYLHVPYCRKICLYCGCNTKMAVRDDVVGAYRHALEAEIDLVASLVGARPKIARLHWGGGTPSILGPDGLRSVIAALRRHFPFANGSEHAIELDPRHVTVALVEALAELGVSRASLGVQDVNPLVQAAIGRLQPLAVIETAVERLRSAGIRNLNFDLMYGLPLQTAASIRKTCALVAAMGPDRIACFGYAHLPRLKTNQRRIDETKLPSQDQRIEQAEVMSEELIRAGYVKIGIDHFARPGDALARAAAGGKLHRNFQGYTEDASGVLLGLGASSISTFADGFAQNTADVPTYVRAIAAGSLASARGCRRDENDRQRAHIIERLMCDFSVDLEAIAPNAEFRDEIARLTAMQSEGLVEIAGAKLTVTQAGRPVVRVVAAIFDTYRCAQAAQFSSAI